MMKMIHLVIFGLAFSIAAQTVDEISAKYKNSQNAIVRKEALHSLSNPQRSKSQQDDQKVLALIREAFKDPHPSIVEEAINQAGELKLLSVDKDLFQLYTEAYKRFSGYSERIECAIFTAAGKIGGENSRKILVNALENDNGSGKSSILLEAVGQMNDSSLVSSLVAYADRLDKQIKLMKQSGEDPLFYSGKINSLSDAREIASNLSNGKAGR